MDGDRSITVKLREKLLCGRGRHDLRLVTAVVQGRALRYSVLTEGAIIARWQCSRCPHVLDLRYETRIILQKPKQ